MSVRISGLLLGVALALTVTAAPGEEDLELPGKVVQERLGHSTIAMTTDTYGHLFPRGDDAAELAAAERLLLG